MASISFHQLCKVASEAGLWLTGVSPAVPKPEEESRLRIWQENGNAGSMAYMGRDPARLSNPLVLLPEAKSVVSLALPYDMRPVPTVPQGYGRVARYAWGQDYHHVFPKLLSEFVELLTLEVGAFPHLYFSDAVPLLERAFAVSAGLGFVGKNTLLIKPKLGSFTLLAELICDLDVTDVPQLQAIEGCKSCTRCLDRCPTSAFDSAYRLDARLCISYLSIEKRGALAENERRMLGNWIFGCDICQEVCPYNYTSLKKARSPATHELGLEHGVGPFLELAEILMIPDDEIFKKRFKGTPLLRSRREGLMRNAICVALNTDCKFLIPQLEKIANYESNSVVKECARWAIDSWNSTSLERSVEKALAAQS